MPNGWGGGVWVAHFLTKRHTDGQTDRQTDMTNYLFIDIHFYCYTHYMPNACHGGLISAMRNKNTCRQTDRQTARQTDIQTDMTN